MPIKVLLPTALQKLTQNKQEIEIEIAEDILTLIEELNSCFPGIKDRLCDENGKLRAFVNIFVNGEDIRFLEEERTKLSDGDEVSIIPAIAGGENFV
jgi:MoaD family protein